MNRLILLIFSIFLLFIIVTGPATATRVWNDPNGRMAGNWNFNYDDEDPFTIGLYCCWFDLVQRMIDNMTGGYSSLGMTTDPYEGYGEYAKEEEEEEEDVETDAWTGEVDGKTDETEVYCPSCHPENSIKKPSATRNQVSAEVAYIRSLIQSDETLQKRGNKTYISSLSTTELLEEFGSN